MLCFFVFVCTIHIMLCSWLSKSEVFLHIWRNHEKSSFLSLSSYFYHKPSQPWPSLLSFHISHVLGCSCTFLHSRKLQKKLVTQVILRFICVSICLGSQQIISLLVMVSTMKTKIHKESQWWMCIFSLNFTKHLDTRDTSFISLCWNFYIHLLHSF